MLIAELLKIRLFISVHVPHTPHALPLPPLREESRKDYTSEELILWSRLHCPTKSTCFANEADFIGRWSQLHFWGGCLYVFQTLIAHGVMVAYYVVTLVELGGDTSAYSWVVNHSTCLLAIGWWLSDMPFNWFISFCLAAKRALKSEESRKDYTNEEFLAQQPVVGSLAMRLCADSSYGFRFWFHYTE